MTLYWLGKIFYHKSFAVLFDLISDLPELFVDLLIRTGRFCGVGEIVVKFLYSGRNIGAVLFGMITHGYHVIKINVPIFINVVGGVAGNVHPVFLHYCNSFWIDTVLLLTGTVNFCCLICI